MNSRRIVLTVSLVLSCLSRGVTGEADPLWYACETVDECQWLIGEGGWPVAVRADSAQPYLEWVQTRAPFTTYFMPGDCFVSDEQFKNYLNESRTRVKCVERQCSLGIRPRCAK